MEEEEEEEEPWEGKKRSRVALRSSALASNHRGGKRAGCTKNVGTLTVRTVHGTGGTCWAGLGWAFLVLVAPGGTAVSIAPKSERRI